MPIDVGGKNITITGGNQLKAFIGRAKGVSNRQLAGAAARVYRKSLVPRLRTRMPRRSGRLKSSLAIRQQGDSVELRGVFYARMVRFPKRSRTKSVESETFRELQDNRNIYSRQIARELRRRIR